MALPIYRTLPSLFLWQFIAVGSGLLTQIVLARYLGPHDKGIVDLFLLVPIVLTSVGDAGLLSANTYFAGKGSISFGTLHKNSVVWSVLVGLLFIIVAVTIIVLGGSPVASLPNNWFILAVALVIPSLYSALWTGLMYGSEQASRAYKINAMSFIISLVMYLVIALLRAPLSVALTVSAATLLVKAGIAWTAIRSNIKNEKNSPDIQALKQSLSYGGALYIGIALNMLHFRFVQFAVESMLGPAALGYFALAVRVAEMVWLLDFIIINASIFKITSSSPEESILVTQRMSRVIAFIVASSSLFLFITSPILIPLMFGEEFSPSVEVLWLLLPGIIAWSVARSLSQFIAYQKAKPWVNTTYAAITLAVNVLLMVFLIPRLGIIGASLSSTASYLTMLALTSNYFFRTTRAAFFSTFFLQREDIHLLKRAIREQFVKTENT